MLDHFSIFTRNGIVLWSKTLAPSISSNNPVDSLIRSSFIEERAAEAKFDKDGYTLRWTFANDVELVFVVVYQRILQLSYIPELLDNVKSLFISQFGPFARSLSSSTRSGSSSSGSPISARQATEFNDKLAEWDATFVATLRRLEKSASAKKRIVSASASGPTTPLDERSAPNLEGSAPGTPSKEAAAGDGKAENDVARNVEALKARLKAEGAGSPGGRRGAASAKNRKSKGGAKGNETPGTSGTDTPVTGAGKKKAAKEMRKWDSNGNAIDVRAMDQLDFSGAGAQGGATSGDDDDEGDISGWVDERSMGKKNAQGMYEIADVDEREGGAAEDDEDDEDEGEGASKGGFLSRFGGLTSTSTPSLFSRITGSQPLTRADLAPALNAMQAHLQSKNVAADVASRLCDSVAQGLVGKQLGSFGSVKKEVRKALEEAITRILTPKSSTDILLEIATKRQSPRAPSAPAPDPYSIAFVGVNGVGKSTNLSKVCFWLLQNKLRVLIAACDTFRSGAVEQLRVHVRNLGKLEVDGEVVGDAAAQGGRAQIELYERGYGKDAAGIAKEALAYAKKSGFDVVLIDTAGRMQDNEPLMRALAKLVAVNDPDKIIFVGEALVGNEAVDQLTKFDRSLKDFSGVSRPRGLDGMLLTKFDTIDDKVGTSLTATSVTGLPIYFVGVGQTYTDLKQLRVRHVVAALMRD